MGGETLYFRGHPTEIEVALLMDAFGVPDEGAVFTDAQVEEIIKTPRHTHRYQTVTQVWKRRLFRLHNLKVVRRGGQFVVLTPAQRVEYSAGQVIVGIRGIRRGAALASNTDPASLNEQQRSSRDHQVRLCASIDAQVRLDAKKIAPALPLPLEPGKA